MRIVSATIRSLTKAPNASNNEDWSPLVSIAIPSSRE